MLMLNEMMNGMCVLVNRGMLRRSWLSRMLLHGLQLVLHGLQLTAQCGDLILQIRLMDRRPWWRGILRTDQRAIGDQQPCQHECTHQELLHNEVLSDRKRWLSSFHNIPSPLMPHALPCFTKIISPSIFLDVSQLIRGFFRRRWNGSLVEFAA